MGIIVVEVILQVNSILETLRFVMVYIRLSCFLSQAVFKLLVL